MTLKLAVAAVLRVFRTRTSRTQESMSDAGSRTYLADLEQGRYGITLEKLHAISPFLEISPLTFLTLVLSTSEGKSTQKLLIQAQAELEDFERSGGMEQLQAQINQGALVARRPGRQVDQDKLRRILECKAQGMTQKAAAVALGIPKQTVHDLWKRNLDC